MCRLSPAQLRDEVRLLPRHDEALNAFACATVFSSLDFAITYHKVPVKPADVEKTAFITHVGLNEILMMPFSLFNAPSTDQRLMMSMLQSLIGHICLAYLDDVIVFSKRRDEHVNDLRAVLDCIRDAGLKLKPAKCKLFCEQVLYLGHVISPAGVCPYFAKLRVLADWPLPTTVRELQSFFGIVNFYSDFIDEQTALTFSLYDLIAARKGTEPVTSLAKTSSDSLSSSAVSVPRLASRTRILKRRSRCILMRQKSLSAKSCFSATPQELSARYFYFKKLFSAQRNYFTFERECLAVGLRARTLQS